VSVDIVEALAYVAAKDYAALSVCSPTRFSRWSRAGADFAAIASNTPHVVFDELRAASPVELLSIVEATCAQSSAAVMNGLCDRPRCLPCARIFTGTVARRAGVNLVIPAMRQARHS
jgi:aspartate racemase